MSGAVLAVIALAAFLIFGFLFAMASKPWNQCGCGCLMEDGPDARCPNQRWLRCDCCGNAVKYSATSGNRTAATVKK